VRATKEEKTSQDLAVSLSQDSTESEYSVIMIDPRPASARSPEIPDSPDLPSPDVV
jgi:hypothetical protein